MVSETTHSGIRLLKIQLASEKKNFQAALKEDHEFSYLKNILNRIRHIERDIHLSYIKKN